MRETSGFRRHDKKPVTAQLPEAEAPPAGVVEKIKASMASVTHASHQAGFGYKEKVKKSSLSTPGAEGAAVDVDFEGSDVPSVEAMPSAVLEGGGAGVAVSGDIGDASLSVPSVVGAGVGAGADASLPEGGVSVPGGGVNVAGEFEPCFNVYLRYAMCGQFFVAVLGLCQERCRRRRDTLL